MAVVVVDCAMTVWWCARMALGKGGGDNREEGDPKYDLHLFRGTGKEND